MFFFLLFFWYFGIFLPLLPLRGQPAVSCQPCWLPNKEWHVPAGWRDAGFEPGTTGFTVWCPIPYHKCVCRFLVYCIYVWWGWGWTHHSFLAVINVVMGEERSGWESCVFVWMSSVLCGWWNGVVMMESCFVGNNSLVFK